MGIPSGVVGAPSTARSRHPRVPLIIGVVAPLAFAGLAYALFLLSDRLGGIGPLDRAAFGWSITMPLWVAAPVIGGFTWARLPRLEALLVAMIAGVLAGGVAAVLLWQSIAFPDCAYGVAYTPAERVPPALFFGAMIGGGMALSGLATAGLARQRRRFLAVIAGVAAEVAAFFATIVVVGTMLAGPSCQRPSV